ncbi:MAG: UDP-N-acetylglucosamine 2-epimerase (non-hydrolyzing) [Candidatus Omnitrophica bacterium]|nr:UDP-N-acetylglucosamine 2-epimerase (non-hydrolyzing) [Candidatus Omnitrophota bacterium]
MKIAFIFGTRPEIIKLSSVIRLSVREKIPFVTIHTGQHYSTVMSRRFFRELDLPMPDYNLNIRSKAPWRQGDHTGRMMMRLEQILLKELPGVVVVHGDTNSTLAGALTASKISTTKAFTGFDIKLAHVEAGLRSYDRSMPEEINRIMADHLSDLLFVPTVKSRDIVLSEGVKRKKVFVTGNTFVDTLYFKRPEWSGNLPGSPDKGGYILLTIHRQENVDDKKRFVGILKAIKKIGVDHKLPIIFPAHPRTVKKMEEFGISVSGWMELMEPCAFTEFIALEANAALILTDSGGVQEEACVLLVPCVTLRDSTERPETVDVGANIIAGIDPVNIVKSARVMLSRKRDWKNPFGDGRAAERILDVLVRQFGRKK